MKDVILRNASKADAAAIAEIEAICFPEAWSEPMVTSAMENGTFYIGAYLGDKLVGYAAAAIVLDEGQVANIALDPAARGKGLGRALTKALIDRCFEAGCSFITLEVRHTNTVAINLYTSLCFRQVGLRKNYYSNPTADAILMTLTKED